MTTRRVLAAGAILALIPLAIVLLRNNDEAEEVRSPLPPKSSAGIPAHQDPVKSPLAKPQPAVFSPPPARDTLVGQPALVAPQLSELTTTDTPSLASRLGAPNTRPEQEAAIVLDLLKIYRRLFGTYPAGENNNQFMNALLGANKEKLPLLAHDHPRLNARGELTDAWGTPFFFHQNSRNSIEVRSAGADCLLYTDDDIVAGRPPRHAEPLSLAEASPNS